MSQTLIQGTEIRLNEVAPCLLLHCIATTTRIHLGIQIRTFMKNLLQSLLPLFMVGGLCLPSYGQAPAKKPQAKHEMAEPTKEQRNKMAMAHEQMATCLRSDKSMEDCHDEMRKSCKEMGDQCPMMMGHHGMGMGMGMGKMKHPNEKDKDENKDE